MSTFIIAGFVSAVLTTVVSYFTGRRAGSSRRLPKPQAETPQLPAPTPSGPTEEALRKFARLGLDKRLEQLGLKYSGSLGIEFISNPAKAAFYTATKDDKNGIAACPKCNSWVNTLISEVPAAYPKKLGWFCTNCGQGRLIIGINEACRANGLPELPDGNIFALLKVLERYAIENGILQLSSVESNSSTDDATFVAVVRQSGDYRNMELKVRVDVKARTVVICDEERPANQFLHLVK